MTKRELSLEGKVCKFKKNMKMAGLICLLIGGLLIVGMVWIFYPYVQIGGLSKEYGGYFEERYKEISWYEDMPYCKPRVARFKGEKARIHTDAGFLKDAIEDEREDVAVVYYGIRLYMEFCYVDGEWVIDGWNEIWTGPTDCQVWPVYFS